MNLLELYRTTQCLSDKENYHKYITYFYNNKFEKYKNIACNILEIGIQYGYSIKLWESYFKISNIYGVDINPLICQEFSPRVKIYKDNAYSNSFIDMIESQNLMFDIIIDDGPHTVESQIYVLEHYKKFIKPNGILIIEDIYLKNLATLLHNYPNLNIVNCLSYEPDNNRENNSIILFWEQIK